MTAPDAAGALACARRLLEPKRADQYQYRIAPSFSAAREVLLRVVGEGPAPIEVAGDAERAEAKDLLERVDEHAQRHVAALRKSLPDELELEEGAWLGHLVPLREDFRGVPAVEALCAELGYDELARKHAKEAEKLLVAWYREKDEGELYAAVLEHLPRAFLFDGFPPELAERVEAWRRREKELKVPRKVAKAYAGFEAWRDGWKDGVEAARDVDGRWKPR